MSKGGKRSVVVLAVDSSPQSELAFHWYMEHGYRKDHQLVLVHCIEEPITMGGDVEAAGVVYSRMLNEASLDGTDVKEKFCTLLGLREIPARYISAIHPKPGKWIADVAEEENASMIVTGSRGLKTLSRTILGSVSTQVLHYAKCPVTVCKIKKGT